MKVLVGCPVHECKDYITDRYMERLSKLEYRKYDVMLVSNSRSAKWNEKMRKACKQYGFKFKKVKWTKDPRARLVAARNFLREYTIQFNYDYFFNLEQDVIPPKNILTELVKWKKDVVGGWYYINKGGKKVACWSDSWKPVNELWEPLSPVDFRMGEQRLIKSYLGSLGVCLIHRSVLEQIQFRLIPHFPHPDDSWFYYDCKKKEIDVWVDTDLLVPHFQSASFEQKR